MTKWYAVQMESTDDWGYGSHDLDEALEMLKEQGGGQIAVIDEDSNYCLDEIPYEECYN